LVGKKIWRVLKKRETNGHLGEKEGVVWVEREKAKKKTKDCCKKGNIKKNQLETQKSTSGGSKGPVVLKKKKREKKKGKNFTKLLQKLRNSPRKRGKKAKERSK